MYTIYQTKGARAKLIKNFPYLFIEISHSSLSRRSSIFTFSRPYIHVLETAAFGGRFYFATTSAEGMYGPGPTRTRPERIAFFLCGGRLDSAHSTALSHLISSVSDDLYPLPCDISLDFPVPGILTPFFLLLYAIGPFGGRASSISRGPATTSGYIDEVAGVRTSLYANAITNKSVVDV